VQNTYYLNTSSAKEITVKILPTFWLIILLEKQVFPWHFSSLGTEKTNESSRFSCSETKRPIRQTTFAAVSRYESSLSFRKNRISHSHFWCVQLNHETTGDIFFCIFQWTSIVKIQKFKFKKNKKRLKTEKHARGTPCFFPIFDQKMFTWIFKFLRFKLRILETIKYVAGCFVIWLNALEMRM